MREIDMDKIGRKMPYSPPEPEFFESFTEQLIGRIHHEPEGKISAYHNLRKILYPMARVAAVAAVILTAALFAYMGVQRFVGSELLVAQSPQSVDAYLASLSDEDLAALIAQNSYGEDLYINLLSD